MLGTRLLRRRTPTSYRLPSWKDAIPSRRIGRLRKYARRRLQTFERRTNAATSALNQFLEETLAEIKERAPEWYALLDERQEEAEVKREEARRLLAEADASVGESERMRVWLARATGESPLGQYPFAEMPIPTRSHADRAAEAQRVMEAYVQ